MLNFWIGFLFCMVLIGFINIFLLVAFNRKGEKYILRKIILISSPITVILYIIGLGIYRILWYFFGYSCYRSIHLDKNLRTHGFVVLIHPYREKGIIRKNRKYLKKYPKDKLYRSKKLWERNFNVKFSKLKYFLYSTEVDF